MENPWFFAIIPASVRYNKKLCANAKLLYWEITALTHKEWYCFASNNYFAKLYEVNKTTVSEWVSQLLQEWLIKYDILENNMRRIYLVGYSEKAEHNNTYNNTVNNIYNNNEKINKSAYAEWLDYKKKSKKWSMSEFTVKKQIKMLEQYSFEEQQNMIDRSIMNGWIWLFEKEDSIKTSPSSASPLQDKEKKYKKVNREWFTEVGIQTHYWIEERYYRKDETGEIWYFHDIHFNII